MEQTTKAAIFDLDDTLLKTADIKWRHHKAVAKEFYGLDLTDSVLREHWGKPFDTMIGLLYQNADSVENMRQANRSIEARFPKEIQADTRVALDILEEAGIVKAILTSINTDYALLDLELAGIPADQFVVVQGATDTEFHKPDPRVFEPTLVELQKLGIMPTNTTYVGDALIDFYAARDAGLNFIGVATGFVALTEFRKEGALAVPNLRDAALLLAS